MPAINYSSFVMRLRNAVYDVCPTLIKFDVLTVPQCSEANKWVKGFDDGRNMGCLTECSKDHIMMTWPQNSYSVANGYVVYQIVRFKKDVADPAVFPCWAVFYILFSYISYNDMRKCIAASRDYVNDFMETLSDDEYDYILFDT